MSFRLYVQRGCEACDKTIKWFTDHNIELFILDITNSPVIRSGIKLYDRENQPRNPHGVLPVLESYIAIDGKPGEVIVGFQEKEFERLAKLHKDRQRAEDFEVILPPKPRLTAPQAKAAMKT